ncbi:MAG: aromatic amino acid ammonia-lyase [Proteobacteria bacterium]|nr:aromatic amino acid ammonia-lyase [Pseudomonadota bacterium]
MSTPHIEIGPAPLSIEDVRKVAVHRHPVRLSDDPAFVNTLRRGREGAEALWRNNQVVYGVTTGVGEACERHIDSELVDAFPMQLARFHGCGMGAILDETTCRAAVMIRLVSLRSGWSGVRPALLAHLVNLLNHGIIPCIPAEGSVGASGDLTPLSYLAAVIMGERDVYYQGEVMPAAQAYERAGLTPLPLKGKEALAIMNGTAVMTAIACEAVARARNLVCLASRLTALITAALQLNQNHFDPRTFACKPFPGQARVAAHICSALGYRAETYRFAPDQRIQATYAVRCAPHILGVLEDALDWMTQHVAIELNSANDNPLFDPETGDVLHGGNFYGGHIAFAMDGLKNAVANCADLIDRQMALLVNEHRNNGLPPNLSGAQGARAHINHGFKAVHIATSAFAAEALKNSVSASIFSRSTESHNQDKVSMGTIAARDALRVLELTEQTLAATLLGAAQACELRVQRGELRLTDLTDILQNLFAALRTHSDFLGEDRPLDADLRRVCAAIRRGSEGGLV